MKYLEGEYTVRMLNFPGDIHACLKLTRDGSEYPNVYINDQLSPPARRKAFLHEMRHLEDDDFRNEKSIDEAESDYI